MSSVHCQHFVWCGWYLSPFSKENILLPPLQQTANLPGSIIKVYIRYLHRCSKRTPLPWFLYITHAMPWILGISTYGRQAYPPTLSTYLAHASSFPNKTSRGYYLYIPFPTSDPWNIELHLYVV